MTMPAPRTLHHTDGITRYQPVTDDTLLAITRNTAGNQLPGSRFTATYGEAKRERWLDSMNNTMEYTARIADEHAPAYFATEIDWRDGRAVVYEP